MSLKITAGLSYPLGANYDGKGVNFAVYSSSAERMQVCLFDPKEKGEVRIDLPNYTDEVFHGYIPGLKPGQLYGFRAFGPYDPEKGLRFNPNKLLMDPYAKQITRPIIAHNSMLGYNPNSKKMDLSFSRANSASFVPKCIVIDDTFDWQGVEKPKSAWDSAVLYEAHLKGFTANNPQIDKAIRGTCAGMSTKNALAYIKSLGITAIEFLPIASFMTNGFLKDKGLTNYWGYDPIGFMAPHAAYLASRRLVELKHMVRLFHEAGIEVILDVVYNHTGEGNQMGQTICYRGLDNASYYRLNKENPRYYDDTTGCGASFNLDNPRALQLVMDSLRYWADKIQIDGFRFDLATTLARDNENHYTINSNFLATVQQDPTLQSLKLIAEPWDLGYGGYQVGSFRPGWAEWNDKFRDTVRRLWKGDEGQAADFASRLTGSADVYQYHGRRPWASVNFITAHDGFTLWDLVSYNQKHNELNAENNQDGNDCNFSFNSGIEGATKNKEVLKNRFLRASGMMASLLLSFGTPMLQAGDEVLRTRQGNNNSYCQDNQLTWINWAGTTDLGKKMLALVKRLIALRKKYKVMEASDFFNSQNFIWYKPDGHPMKSDDWVYFVRAVSCWIANEKQPLFFIFNAADQDIEWTLPDAAGWHLILDTSDSIKPAGQKIKVPAWSVSVFEKIN